mmetsp:Transcript_5142/g.5664  ORF Transcript_5142/g.5664 Transcript_5142/m.5664 type:complete len:127 (-) Transcript_5142:621-1001(-)
MSDSSYAAATRHRQPASTSGRPPALEIVDDEWAADTLSDDDVNCDAHEAAIATLLDEGDLDMDAVVVSTSHSGSASNGAEERRKREEGRWSDIGLDNFNLGSTTGSERVQNVTPASGSGAGQQQSH